MNREVVIAGVLISRKDFVALEEDAHGAWMSNEDKVAAFLPWFTDDPVAEAPLRLIIMLSSCKNLLRLVSKLFKSHAEEGTRRINWKGPDNSYDREAFKTCSLMPLVLSSVRDRDGRTKDRLPNLKSINCEGLDTLMNLNGCPSGLEELSSQCPLIQSLAPLATCTNLRKLNIWKTKVSNLKPLMRCMKLEWLDISETSVSDISPLSACINLKVLWMAENDVFDFSPLSGLHQLRALDLSRDFIVDESFLTTLTRLDYLDCEGNEISDLTPLSKCSELKALNIIDTKVDSLTPLLQCKKLKYLNHGNLRDMSKEETRAYLRLFKELMPELECTEVIDWWAKFPDTLQHGWDCY